MSRTVSIKYALDWTTVLYYIVLVVMGWLSIYGASYDFDQSGILNWDQRAGKQFVWILTSFGLAGILLLLDYKIYNYFSMNWLYYELVELSNKYERDELWSIIDNKYRSLYNSKSTEFERLCPKELTAKHYEIELNKILSKYNVSIGDINKIIALFN